MDSLPERKYFDTNSAASAVNLAQNGVIVYSSLNLVTQGNGENQMIGRKMVIKRISMKGQMNFIAQNATGVANVTAGDKIRLVLILDKQCNGAAATISQIFQDQDIESFLNLENKSRFQVLKEWIGIVNREITFNPTAGQFAVGNALLDINFSKKCNIPIEFAPEVSAGTRAIEEIKSNNLLLVGFNQSSVAQNVSIITRIRYTDD